MGADCCGTPEAQQNGTPHNMQNGTNLITKDAPVPAKGKHAHQTARPHKEYVQAREPYYKKRVDLFQQYHQREVDKVAEAKEANKSISITLPDGNVQSAVAGVTTPMDIAKALSKSLAKKVVVAKVKPEGATEAGTWDLLRPLETNSTLELFSFEDKVGKDVSTFPLCTHACNTLGRWTSAQPSFICRTACHKAEGPVTLKLLFWMHMHSFWHVLTQYAHLH